ncbi:MAG: type II toxin-antitoxin system VapC family toxin [Micromonosporaceae bacterium]
MILADTSAWVEFDRATGSPVDLRLTELISSSDDVVVTEPVIAEVTAGARSDDREAELRRLLARFPLLTFDSVADFDGAVRVYRRCRQAGITPRGLLDCMIAAVALRHDAAVLAHDADMARIADVMPLRLDKASFRP